MTTEEQRRINSLEDSNAMLWIVLVLVLCPAIAAFCWGAICTVFAMVVLAALGIVSFLWSIKWLIVLLIAWNLFWRTVLKD